MSLVLLPYHQFAYPPPPLIVPVPLQFAPFFDLGEVNSDCMDMICSDFGKFGLNHEGNYVLSPAPSSDSARHDILLSISSQQHQHWELTSNQDLLELYGYKPWSRNDLFNIVEHNGRRDRLLSSHYIEAARVPGASIFWHFVEKKLNDSHPYYHKQ